MHRAVNHMVLGVVSISQWQTRPSYILMHHFRKSVTSYLSGLPLKECSSANSKRVIIATTITVIFEDNLTNWKQAVSVIWVVLSSVSLLSWVFLTLISFLTYKNSSNKLADCLPNHRAVFCFLLWQLLLMSCFCEGWVNSTRSSALKVTHEQSVSLELCGVIDVKFNALDVIFSGEEFQLRRL